MQHLLSSARRPERGGRPETLREAYPAPYPSDQEDETEASDKPSFTPPQRGSKGLSNGLIIELSAAQMSVLEGLADALREGGIVTDKPQLAQALMEALASRPQLCRSLMAAWLMKG